MTDPVTLSIPEAAEILGFDQRSMYREVKARGSISAGPVQLPVIRVGARYRIGRAALDNFLAAVAFNPPPLSAAGDRVHTDGTAEPGRKAELSQTLNAEVAS